MKARIVKSAGGSFWIGQIYGTWEKLLIGCVIGEYTDWKTVTNNCYTKLGAKMELMKWKREHCEEEFEI